MNKIELKLINEHNFFKPGSILKGNIIWNIDIIPQTITISLCYWTEGRGTEDAVSIAKEEVKITNPSGEQPFEFPIPNSPWSFSGKLISVNWAVAAEIRSKNLFTLIPITISPTAAEINLYGHPDDPRDIKVKKPLLVVTTTN